MSLRVLFEAVVAQLQQRAVEFAVAGGFAADVYRHQWKT